MDRASKDWPLHIVLPLALRVFSPQAKGGWNTVFGVWPIGIAANYVPMLAYAVRIAHSGRDGVGQAVLLMLLPACLVVIVQKRQHSR